MIENQKKTILVVEDSDNWRTSFCNLLRNYGYEVVEATNGSEFREKSLNANVIILDIALPDEPYKPVNKTMGLDILLELQAEYPAHYAIQNPIIRSMWSKEFFGPRFDPIKKTAREWISRETPFHELLSLIESKIK